MVDPYPLLSQAQLQLRLSWAETIQNGFGSLKKSQLGYTEKIDGIFGGFHDLDKKINEKLKQLKNNWNQVNKHLDGQEK